MDLEKGSESHVVMLPCEPDQFNDFIAGLLGKPQTISRRLYGAYELTRSDAENLHHLIKQRVSSQNDASLMQFTARIVFDDGSSVLLNSFEDFQTYREVKPLISTEVHFSWTYLIRFPEKKYPEKQQIEISFATSNVYGSTEIVGFETVKRIGAPMYVRISHTNRTWGTDIESLLVDHLKGFMKREIGLRAWVAEWSGTIGFAVAVICFVSTLAMAFRITDDFINNYLAQARQFSEQATANFETVSRKVDFLTQVVASGMWTRYAFFVTSSFIIALFVAVFLGIIVGSNAGERRPSFVLLTAQSVETRGHALRKYRNSWVMFVASLVGSLVVATIGNIIFYKLSHLWTF